MDNNDKMKGNIIEQIGIILIMAFYITYGINYMPLLIVLIPLPFIVIGIRNNMSHNIISMVITFIIAAIVLKSPLAGLNILIFAPLSIILNYCIDKKKSPGKTILLGTAVYFFSILVVILLGNKISGLNLVKQFEESLSPIITMQTDIFKEMGMTNTEILKGIELVESLFKELLMILPTIFGIMSLLTSYINYLLATTILRKMGYSVGKGTRFSRFRLPNNIIIGTGVMVITGVIMGKLDIPYHNALLLNISFLVGFIFVLQGLAVLDFLLIKVKMKLVFRLIILAINIISMPITLIGLSIGDIFFLMGVLDSIFDIRKIRRQKSL